MAIEGEQRNWNELLGAKGVFSDELNSITTESKEAADLVAELKELLEREGVLQQLYETYKQSFSKSEDAARTNDSVHAELFKTRLIEFAEHNAEAAAGNHSWTKGVNQFTDMTTEESSRCTGGLIIPEPTECDEGGAEPQAEEAEVASEVAPESEAAPAEESSEAAEPAPETEAAPAAEAESAETEAAPATEAEAEAEAAPEAAAPAEAVEPETAAPAAEEEAEAAPQPDAAPESKAAAPESEVSITAALLQAAPALVAAPAAEQSAVSDE